MPDYDRERLREFLAQVDWLLERLLSVAGLLPDRLHVQLIELRERSREDHARLLDAVGSDELDEALASVGLTGNSLSAKLDLAAFVREPLERELDRAATRPRIALLRRLARLFLRAADNVLDSLLPALAVVAPFGVGEIFREFKAHAEAALDAAGQQREIVRRYGSDSW